MLFMNAVGLSKPGLKTIFTGPATALAAQVRDPGDVMLSAKDDTAEINLFPGRCAEAEVGEDRRRAIQEALKKLLASSLFIQSERLSRFLAFAVQSALKGEADCLKEYTIGIEAYGRRPDFDPSQDSIVRTEARRLRSKLSKYYQEEGSNDSIVIELHPGSYVPSFRFNRPAVSRAIERRPSTKSMHRAITVMPIAHLPGDPLGEACARGLTDEIMHRLTRTAGFEVFGNSLLWGNVLVNGDCKNQCRLISEGTVLTEGNRIRVTSRLCRNNGLHIASWRFDAESKPGGLFVELERIATEIVTRINQYDILQMGV